MLKVFLAIIFPHFNNVCLFRCYGYGQMSHRQTVEELSGVLSGVLGDILPAVQKAHNPAKSDYLSQISTDETTNSHILPVSARLTCQTGPFPLPIVK